MVTGESLCLLLLMWSILGCVASLLPNSQLGKIPLLCFPKIVLFYKSKSQIQGFLMYGFDTVKSIFEDTDS